MSDWRVAPEQWRAWVSTDGAVLRAVPRGALHELDAQLLARLDRIGFPVGEEETISRPSLDDTASFESRPTMVPGADVGDDDDQTRVRQDRPQLEVALLSADSGLEVAFAPAAPDAATVITERPRRPTPAEAPPMAAAAYDGLDDDDAEPVASRGGDEGMDGGDGEDGLFIPALTKTVVAPVPTAPEPAPADDERPPAVTGVTVIAPAPERPPELVESSPLQRYAGVINAEPDEAAQTLIRGEIPSGPQHDDEPQIPRASKVVVDPSASGVYSAAVYDDDDADDEPDELDADDLVEEADEADLVEDNTAPPAPPVAPPRSGLDVVRVAPPVSSASLNAALASLPSAPIMDEGWQIDAFGEHHAALLPVNRAESAALDIDFVLHCLGLGPGAAVLDVGCGDGAHCVALAARGIVATGLDASPVQLMRSTQSAQAAGVAFELVSGDMRRMPHEATYDAVLCLGGTLGMYGDEDDLAAIGQMRERLRPGGRLVLQVLNRDYIVGRLPARSWWQGQGCLVLDEAQMFAPTSRVHVHRTQVFETGQQFEHNLGLRVYGLTELVQLCAQVGLRVIEYSGSRHTRGHFYGATSAEIWLVAQRFDG